MNSFARVKILLRGYFKWLGRNKCRASSTVTLVQDDNKNIIIDTGTHNNRQKLIKALAKENLEPEDINYVIITHAHTDHLENLGIFTQAQSMNVFELKKGDVFQLSEELYNKGEKELTPNTKIIATPGHTTDCISVLVNTSKGKILIAGDLFVTKQIEKGIFVENRKNWEKSRKKMIKAADYIIPGHSGMFKIKK